ncbi:hypothetical protein EYB26_005470 [Talaromyces marneffei]|uniref:uncharacterized protein n=1 Tax=Talaromyces marneffei TaxID=37727 RepID=UPI0012A89F4B|nr:uncharacterized protein EYB26_005470 [Talaromyces marneffei]QGA17794.1 hypothetical protein EYB26_005470 [Talaromyces marneffei]
MQTRKLRSACDICHQAKTRCSGGNPCTGCRNSGAECVYSVSNRLGRPKGTTKYKAQRQRAVNTSSALPNTTRSSSATSDTYKDPSSLNDRMILDPPSDMARDALFVPSPKTFWELISHETMPVSEFILNEDRDNIQNLQIETTSISNSIMSGEQGSGYTTCPFADLLDTANKGGHLSYPAALDFDISSFITPTPNDEVAINPRVNPDPADRLSQSLDQSTLRQDKSSGRPQHRNQITRESNGCECMTHHATLLVQLSNLKNGKGPLSLDNVLISVQQALTPWNHLNQCAVCESDEDQGVLIFSAMTIRTVLALLQRFCAESIYPHRSDERSAIPSSKQLPTGGQITIGKYKASPEEQNLVTSFLITRALSNIRSVLVSLKIKLDRSTRRIKADHLKRRNGGTATDTAGDEDDSLAKYNNQEGESTGVASTLSNVVPGGEEGGCIQILLRSLDATVEEIGKAVPKMSCSSASSETNPFVC